jgi:phosphatidylglycerophosphate synthase
VSDELENRRPLKSRDTGWARRCAAAVARAGISPDAVSAGSLLFAAIGVVALVASGLTIGGARVGLLLLAAVAVQSRLLCNLLDGLVAVEHGRGGPAGAIWNELPDRIADVAFLVGAGYGAGFAGVAWGPVVGWLAAVLAVLTAYVRELGRGLGFAADFCGPGAKPHRMAVLTVACLVAAAEPLWAWRGQSLAIGLAVIAAAAALTVMRRTLHLAAALRGRVVH